MLNMVMDKTEDVQELVSQFANNEAGILITLFQLTDHWPTGAASTTLQKNHAHVLRVHLHRLFEYYFNLAQENKAKLATTLHSTTFFAESQGLTHMQIARWVGKHIECIEFRFITFVLSFIGLSIIPVLLPLFFYGIKIVIGHSSIGIKAAKIITNAK